MITNAQLTALDRIVQHDSLYIQTRTKRLLDSGAWSWDGQRVVVPSESDSQVEYMATVDTCNCIGFANRHYCSHIRLATTLAESKTPATVASIYTAEVELYEDDGQPFNPRRDYRTETARRRQDNADRWRVAGKGARANNYVGNALSDIDRLAWAA